MKRACEDETCICLASVETRIDTAITEPSIASAVFPPVRGSYYEAGLLDSSGIHIGRAQTA